MTQSKFSKDVSCKFKFTIRGLRGRWFFRNFVKFARAIEL